MTRETIRSIIQSRSPAKIFTNDGAAVDVPHEDHLAISKDGEVLIVIGDNNQVNIIDTANVARVEVGTEG